MAGSLEAMDVPFSSDEDVELATMSEQSTFRWQYCSTEYVQWSAESTGRNMVDGLFWRSLKLNDEHVSETEFEKT